MQNWSIVQSAESASNKKITAHQNYQNFLHK